jgi:hypothetical protein
MYMVREIGSVWVGVREGKVKMSTFFFNQLVEVIKLKLKKLISS